MLALARRTGGSVRLSLLSRSPPATRTAMASQSARSLAGPGQSGVRMLSDDAKFGQWNNLRANICQNCYTEGHTQKECTAPKVCAACGVQGHLRKKCPNPDPARLEALKNAPPKCFRCGVTGHTSQDCTQPPKCFGCGQEGHVRRDCTTNPRPPRCFGCGKEGHLRRDCSTNPPKIRATPAPTAEPVAA